MDPLIDFKSCLKAIEEGKFKNVRLPAFVQKFQDDAHRLGDHVQCALQKFCKSNEEKSIKPIVIELSELCYSEESVQGFNNVDRFLCCLFHICNYFIVRNSYKIPMNISKSIKFKKSDIEKASLESQNTRDFLYVLHSHFINAAQRVASDIKDVNCKNEIDLSHDLAFTSLKFLSFFKSKQLEIGRKIFRNFNLYLNNVKFFDSSRLHELHKCLEEVLSQIMPEYQENDFLLYHICKMVHVKGISNMATRDLNSHFTNKIILITHLVNEYHSVKHWKLILSNESCDVYFKNLIDAVTEIRKLKKSKLYLLIFSIVFNNISQLWINDFAENWNELFTSNIVQDLYNRALLPIRDCLGNISEYCRVIKYQMDICFSDFYVMSLIRMLHIIRLCLKFNGPDSVDLLSISREIFKIITRSLKDLKNQCCISKKKLCWTGLVIHYTNTIESLLKHPNANNVWMHMKYCSEELICEIINSEFELPLEWSRFKILFQRWHYACMKLKQHQEALYIAAVFAISYPEEEDEAISMWIQSKLDTTYEEVQGLSFKDVVDRYKERIKYMNRKCTPSDCDLKKLIMMELKSYGSCSGLQSMCPVVFVKLVKRLWNNLKVLKLELWEKAEALTYIISAAISLRDDESLAKFKKHCEEIYNAIMKSQKMNNCRNLLHAGNLKHSLFLCSLKNIQDIDDKTNCSQTVLEYLKNEEEEKVKFGEIVDLNITCNVMPSTNHFTVVLEEKYIKSLNETLCMWEELASMVKSTFLKKNEFCSWLNNIKQIAQLYYLIGDLEQSLISWVLYYRVAKVCANRPGILLGISNIIRECSNLENSQILVEAEEISDELLSKNSALDILITYWLAVGFNYLKNKNRVKCFDYLCKIKESINHIKGTRNYYTHMASYWCLISKFLCLYPEYMEGIGLKHNTELRTVVQKAVYYVNSVSKDETANSFEWVENSEVLLTMLEVNIWAFEFYYVYYQAGPMRLVLNDMYQIFQKLVFPTRTAYILVLLAQVDIMCKKVDDGNTKLTTLKNILGSSLPHSAEGHVPWKKPGLLEVPTHRQEGNDSPRPPSPARFESFYDASTVCDASPVRYVLSDVSLVKCLNHTSRCQCYTCRNFIIQTLYFNTLLLEAQLNQMKGCIKVSCMHYKEGYNVLKKLESYRYELNMRILDKYLKLWKGMNSLFDFQSQVVKIESIKFLIHYSFFMLLPTLKENMTEDVYKVISRIDKYMSSLSFEQKLLQWQVMELKLITFVIDESQKKKTQCEKVASVVPKCQVSIPTKTPMATRRKDGTAAPVKYKQTKNSKSPNSFVLKPNGRKVFCDDDESAQEVKPVAAKCQAAESLKKPLGTRRKEGSAGPLKQSNQNPVNMGSKKVFSDNNECKKEVENEQKRQTRQRTTRKKNEETKKSDINSTPTNILAMKDVELLS